MQLDIFQGQSLRDAGIQAAVDHAEDVHPNWADRAYQALVTFIASRKKDEVFMAEDIRAVAKVAEPPSQRAWGAIIRKAAQKGLIERCGTGAVKNATAHRALASVWRAVI